MLTGKCSGVAMSLAILALMGEAAAGRGQTGPTEEPSPETVAKLIAQLGAVPFRLRQQATDELTKLGDPVLPALRKAATKSELEVRRRIELVVIRIQAASVERLVKTHCAKQGIARDQVEPLNSALAPAGRAFRYKLAAVPAKDKQAALPERYAFVFVDPEAGNVYSVKRMPGGDKALTQRTLAILRLIGTKVGDSKQATAVMAGLWRVDHGLDGVAVHDDAQVRFVQAIKGERWIDPPITYVGDSDSPTPHVVMPVDQDGYVTDFRMWPVK
jgi:hypothetical protein